MSDLQLSLLLIGAMVVGAVLVYNWMQERSLRRRLKQAFGEAPEDVLLRRGDVAAADGERVEPKLPGQPVPVRGDPPAAAPGRPAASFARIPDPALDYVAELHADNPLPDAAIDELLSRIAGCAKPTPVSGFDAESGEWEELVRGGGYRKLRVGLQLVNRSGAVTATHLAMFCDAIQSCSERVSGRAICPDAQAALDTARDLDAFCAAVDVAIGVNVIAEEGGAFSGTQIRALAEASGFKLEPDGVFHFRNERRQTQFTLDNHEPAPFLPERLKSLTTRGITLMLDVPRVEEGLAVLDRMLEIGHGLAAALGGRLVDDNRARLTDAGMARIREQVRSIHAAMAVRGMAAGDERALRLFA